MFLGEGKGNPLQCSCLENLRDGGAWWAALYGITQCRTWLKRLSSKSSDVIWLFQFHSLIGWLWKFPEVIWHVIWQQIKSSFCLLKQKIKKFTQKNVVLFIKNFCLQSSYFLWKYTILWLYYYLKLINTYLTSASEPPIEWAWPLFLLYYGLLQFKFFLYPDSHPSVPQGWYSKNSFPLKFLHSDLYLRVCFLDSPFKIVGARHLKLDFWVLSSRRQ